LIGSIHKHERGNVLFLILIGVMLFAALSYVVTNSTRTTSTEIAEVDRLAAARIMNQITATNTAVLRMLASGIPKEQIDFVYDAKASNGSPLNNYQDNPNCNDAYCMIYKGQGGVPAPIFTDIALAPYTGGLAPGHMLMNAIRWPGAGTDLNDIVLVYGGIIKPVCLAFNKMINLTTYPTLTGTSPQAPNPSVWDTSTRVITSTNVLGRFAYASTLNASIPGLPDHCTIMHLVIER
jgi:hypothetical protein